MITRISSKGQVVLPAELREQDHIEPGQEFEVQRLDEGEYLLRRKQRRGKGWVKLLFACPVRGALTPVDSPETTDDVRVPEL